MSRGLSPTLWTRLSGLAGSNPLPPLMTLLKKRQLRQVFKCLFNKIFKIALQIELKVIQISIPKSFRIVVILSKMSNPNDDIKIKFNQMRDSIKTQI